MEKFLFTEGETKQFEQHLNEVMLSPIKRFEKELSSIRTGRASTKLIEGIKVESYGQIMNLKDIASLAAPDARLLTIQPWDKSIISNIEKAIQVSDVGITPMSDGDIIRLQLPQMSSQRRDELVKVLGKKTEECRISVRGIRKEYNNMLRDAEKKHSISEDFAKRLAAVLTKATDSFMHKTDDLNHKKEAEICHV